MGMVLTLGFCKLCSKEECTELYRLNDKETYHTCLSWQIKKSVFIFIPVYHFVSFHFISFINQ